MVTPLVWSERVEPDPSVSGLHDCTYAAVLMVLVGAGKTDFQYGMYSVSEREALERSDSRADETGSTFTYTDEAILRRYRLHMLGQDVNTATGIRALLNTPGLVIALAGSYRALPADHPWRRWQKTFVGGHAVCVVTLGNGKVRWLDPLAPNKYAGDVGSVNDAMAFAWAGNSVRYLKMDSLSAVPDTAMEEAVNYLKGADPILNRRAVIGAGATVRTSPTFNPKDYNGNALFKVGDAGSSAPALAWVVGSNLTLADGSVFDASTKWLAIQGKDYGIGFIHARDVIRLDPIVSDDGVHQSDLDAANARIAKIKSIVKNDNDAVQKA